MGEIAGNFAHNFLRGKVMETTSHKKNWREIVRACLRPQAVALFFLGFSAGLPLLLIFSTLSMWLREAGVSRSAVTFFSWAALAYSFKFLWAPLVDLVPIPILTRVLGRRRAWLLLAQFAVVGSIVAMACIDPLGGLENHALLLMSFAAVGLGFSSATQDTVIDAYRIECAEESMQALLGSMYIAGYRVGMLASGAGSLFLAQWLGTSARLYQYSAWRTTYEIMALLMGVGLVTTLLIREPPQVEEGQPHQYAATDYLRLFLFFLCCAGVFAASFFYGGSWLAGMQDGGNSPLAIFFYEGGRFGCSLVFAVLFGWSLSLAGFVNRQMVYHCYVVPVADFFVRYGVRTALILLLLVGFYRLSDIVLGVISNVFYLDLGFTKSDIAAVSKSFGLIMSLAGGFLGGMLSLRYGVYAILMLGAVLSAATNLLFLFLTRVGADIAMLALVIGADNLAAGVASAAFIAFLSSLTNISFTAMQYAVFSSIMTLMPKLMGGYSGTIVAAAGYDMFFLCTAAMGLPVMLLVWVVWRRMS